MTNFVTQNGQLFVKNGTLVIGSQECCCEGGCSLVDMTNQAISGVSFSGSNLTIDPVTGLTQDFCGFFSTQYQNQGSPCGIHPFNGDVYEFEELLGQFNYTNYGINPRGGSFQQYPLGGGYGPFYSSGVGALSPWPDAPFLNTNCEIAQMVPSNSVLNNGVLTRTDPIATVGGGPWYYSVSRSLLPNLLDFWNYSYSQRRLTSVVTPIWKDGFPAVLGGKSWELWQEVRSSQKAVYGRVNVTGSNTYSYGEGWYVHDLFQERFKLLVINT